MRFRKPRHVPATAYGRFVHGAAPGREADRAVPVFLVVPMHQFGHPAPGLQQVHEWFERELRPVLQGLEQRLGVRVVVAHGWTAAAVRHAQALHGGEHRFAFHGAAVVRMHRDLVGTDVLAPADVLQQCRRLFGSLAIEDLPAHHLAAEDVHEQVQVEEQTPYLGG